jgi:UDP-glucuronate 4-epimerase
MTSFLVTGAAGFIGYHLSRRLLEQGHTVTGFDGMTSYYDVQLKRARVALLAEMDGFRIVEAMLDDRRALEAAAEIACPDVIIHLAAQAGVRYSLEQPQTYIASNLVGSWHVLELARELRPAHLLMASTSSVYGANAKVPFCERDRADEPLSLYAATKKGMEALAHSYSALFDIPSTMFRFFTVYGPWGRPDMALFKFVEAIERGQPIDVYGHGAMARDFTYVDDLIDAIVRLVPLAPAIGCANPGELDSLSASAPFRSVNIGGGQPVALMDFIAMVEHCLGRKAALNMLDMQPGDVPRTFADPALLRTLTGYVPQTSMRAGVDAFVHWYRSYYAPARQRPAARAA